MSMCLAVGNSILVGLLVLEPGLELILGRAQVLVDLEEAVGVAESLANLTKP